MIRIGFDFEVLHEFKEYIVAVYFWCRQSDFDSDYAVINPNENSITSRHWLEDQANLLEEVKRIRRDV